MLHELYNHFILTQDLFGSNADQKGGHTFDPYWNSASQIVPTEKVSLGNRITECASRITRRLLSREV